MADSPSNLPDFTASMTGNQTFRLADYAGKTLVFYFYPKDNTPGCTTESIAFRDHYDTFLHNNAVVFGISRDSLRSHENFKAKLALPFELISDPDEALCLQFGVMKLKKMYGKEVRGIERSTFIIAGPIGQQTIIKEWRGLKVPGHVDEVVKFINP